MPKVKNSAATADESYIHDEVKNTNKDKGILTANRFADAQVICRVETSKVLSDGQVKQSSNDILVEHILDVYINSVLTMQIICTPDNLIELVIGRLFTEGVIADISQVESIYICEYGTRAQVTVSGVNPDFSHEAPKIVPTCCTGNKTFNTYFADDSVPDPVAPIPWQPEWIFTAAHKFAEGSPYHMSTGGAHSCYLLLHGEVLTCCEDLGRHNAFDKALGFALLNGINLREVMLFSSGRIPADMVMKAIRAGIPILASKAVPTDRTIDLAKQFNLTLICSAHMDSFTIYNDPTTPKQGIQR
jgi:FdhD protein